MSKLLTTWRDLTLVRPIELGGMSDIYVALAPDHQRYVLKRLKEIYQKDKRIRKQFLHGIEVQSRLRHASIIEFVEGGYDEENVPYLLLSYFESKTLRQLLLAKSELLSSHLRLILLQIAEGVSYLHQSGYIHTDLKPENILINEYGDLRIIDFDLAQEKKKKPARLKEISGTPAYLAPEVLQNKRIDEYADIYSLGVVCYEILTGNKPPIPGSSSAQARILEMEGDLLRVGCKPSLAGFVFKCLDPDPMGRYPAMILALKELNKIL